MVELKNYTNSGASQVDFGDLVSLLEHFPIIQENPIISAIVLASSIYGTARLVPDLLDWTVWFLKKLTAILIFTADTIRSVFRAISAALAKRFNRCRYSLSCWLWPKRGKTDEFNNGDLKTDMKLDERVQAAADEEEIHSELLDAQVGACKSISMPSVRRAVVIEPVIDA
ncbi:hypothetical protein [Nisaea denitrificans]|uniref:hypothetical protein n=1 Tax=Nisaea denitrificans TaxID=390877 RepID=UPI0012EBB86B|nr:hypothetical protein [Nisaea denitrificans]